MLTKKRKNSETGTLQRATAPANSEISTAYLNNGLAAICDKDEGISFYVGWTAKDFDLLFRTHLPKAMDYLDLVNSTQNAARDSELGGHESTEEYRWCILSKKGGKLSVALRGSEVTADSRVKDLVVGQGKSWKDKVLYIGES